MARPLLGLLVFLAAAGIAVAQEPLVTTTVGIEGRYLLSHDGPPLEVKPLSDESPILIRIAGSASGDDGQRVYDLRFIAIDPGSYDLRDSLQYGTDRPAGDLPPLPVRVDSLLPFDHDGGLAAIDDPLIRIPGRPTTWVIVALLLWTLPVLGLLLRRLLRRPEPDVAEEEPEPTLADQLRPLVERALSGTLDDKEKARLEVLLLTHWRETLSLGSFGHGEAIARMRRHPEAGALLRRVEEWLHGGERHPVKDSEVRELLEPYGEVAAVDLESAAAAPAGGGSPTP